MTRKNKPVASVGPKTPPNDLECPKCGGQMAWKYLTEPRCPKCNPVEIDRKAPTRRANRYVYHIHGHARLHATNQVHHISDAPNLPVVPFEVVLRRPFAIDSDEAMEEVRVEVREHVVQQLSAQDSPYIVGDVMIRGVSKLHRILVEADDPEGPAVRIMS